MSFIIRSTRRDKPNDYFRALGKHDDDATKFGTVAQAKHFGSWTAALVFARGELFTTDDAFEVVEVLGSSASWRSVAENCWRAGDIDAATFAHGQALQSEAREVPACKTVSPVCPSCSTPFTVEHCPYRDAAPWVAWCDNGSVCGDILHGGTRGHSGEAASRILIAKWEAANE